MTLPWPLYLMWLVYRAIVAVVRFTTKKSARELAWIKAPPVEATANQFARLLFEHANAFRSLHGRPPLTWNDRLSVAAYNHAFRMGESGEFAHVLSDGLDIGERVELAQYRYQAYRENIAYYEAPGSSIAELAEWMHQGWVNSPGHRENLLARDVTELGVGVVKKYDRWYAVQNFGAPLKLAS